ncbi:hypothetical protein SAMN05444004_109115 [Jannaschia faecimaris]|uniref:Uncharacterized protein n=1 Tax=Jannaschia faecimaris TaxID=1244108 RepID=A0A1H3RSV0_9RHOB|nr:hypothetical protein [Jannaschia faecimaris]SDZ28753.1 hypothetical protein SAMN05444004_109115 [Jannaschia faecimaris]
MYDLSDHSVALSTNYQREQAEFARLKADLQRRKWKKWLLALALVIVGRRADGQKGR